MYTNDTDSNINYKAGTWSKLSTANKVVVSDMKHDFTCVSSIR